MRLTQLEAEFIRLDEPNVYRTVATIQEAHGVLFLCPLCFVAADASSVGVHSVICWSRSRGVPDAQTPGPGRWDLVGTGLEDLTLEGELGPEGTRSARSVLLTSGCGWHGFVTNGEAA